MEKYKKGFTLIELIVVIGIIALLASIVLMFLGDAKNKGNDTAKIQTISDIRKALQSYAVDFGGFPATSAELTTKYIASIDSKVLYEGIDISGNTCTVSPCPSYHLAIPLQSKDNKVLSSDANITTTLIDGKKDNCSTTGNISIPDLCYDVTP